MVAATAIALIGPAAAVAAADATATATHGAPTRAALSPPAAPHDPSVPAGPVAAPPGATGLTIEVLGGGTPTDERSAIDYTIELRNAGSLAYRHLAVSAILPSGFHVLHSRPQPIAAAGPTWNADLAPGQTVDIDAEVAAGSVQDLTGSAPDLLAQASAPDAQAWYSVTACVRRTPGDPPLTCGLSSQLLVKTDDDTRRGIDAIVLLLGLPAVVAVVGIYLWQARRDPEAGRD
ncbi:MAG: hypothetical protein HOV83_06085 [Catenulispora sp.]|nr:hypothetical protein [Catenulispora sp.]